jgi:hypothetical protein
MTGTVSSIICDPDGLCDLLADRHIDFAVGQNTCGKSLCEELMSLPLDWQNNFC